MRLEVCKYANAIHAAGCDSEGRQLIFFAASRLTKYVDLDAWLLYAFLEMDSVAFIMHLSDSAQTPASAQPPQKPRPIALTAAKPRRGRPQSKPQHSRAVPADVSCDVRLPMRPVEAGHAAHMGARSQGGLGACAVQGRKVIYVPNGFRPTYGTSNPSHWKTGEGIWKTS